MKKVEVEVDVDLKDGISDVDKLVASMAELTNEMKSAKEESDDLGSGLDKAGKDGKKGLGGIATGFRGVGSAIKAAGIGLVIAAFITLKEVLEKQQPVLDFIDTAFTAIGLTISTVTDTIKTIYGRITETTESFDALGKVFNAGKDIIVNLLKIAFTPLRLTLINMKLAFAGLQLAYEKVFGDETGVKKAEENISKVTEEYGKLKDSLVESGKAIGDSTKAIVDNAKEAAGELTQMAKVAGEEFKKIDGDQILSDAQKTTELKKNAQIREAQNKKLFEQYDREAELLRQQRDDTTLTTDERIAANDKLAVVLDKQEKLMLANANAITAAAQAEFNANATTENRVALINAEAEAEAIRADITGRRSEQLINEIALDKEVQDAKDVSAEKDKTRAENALALEQELKQARIDAGLEDPNATLDEILAKYEDKADLEDELYALEQEKILEQFEDKVITEKERDAQLEKLKFDHEQKKLKITKDSATAEIKINDARLQSALVFANAVGGAISALGQLAEEGSAQQKLLALSEIAIGTGVGFINALDIAQKSAKGTGPAAAFAFPIFYATQVAAVLGAVGQAKSALSKAKGGGAVPTFSAPSISSTSDPATQPGLTTDTIGTSQDVEGVGSEVIGDGAGQNQVIKAFVVESDITEAQANASTIEDQAIIGG